MNQTAISFVKEHEGCKLTAYQDSGGVWTVGWGATGRDIGKDTVWTQAQADARLASDIGATEAGLETLLSAHGASLSTPQKAALISFAFNLGLAALSKSQLLEAIKQRDFIRAAREFIRWDHAGGKEVKGLLIRRLDEAALFLRGS